MEPAIFPQASTFTGTCPPCQTGGHVSGVCVSAVRGAQRRFVLAPPTASACSPPPRTAHLLRAPPTSQTCFLKNGLCVFLRCRARRLTAFAHLQGRALNNWPRLRPLLVETVDAGDVMGDKNVSGGSVSMLQQPASSRCSVMCRAPERLPSSPPALFAGVFRFLSSFDGWVGGWRGGWGFGSLTPPTLGSGKLLVPR